MFLFCFVSTAQLVLFISRRKYCTCSPSPNVSVLSKIFCLGINIPVIVIAELFAVDKHKRVANADEDRNQKKYSQKNVWQRLLTFGIYNLFLFLKYIYIYFNRAGWADISSAQAVSNLIFPTVAADYETILIEMTLYHSLKYPSWKAKSAEIIGLRGLLWEAETILTRYF